MAVDAVFSELLSGGDSLVSGKNIGNFSILVQLGSKEMRLSLEKSHIYCPIVINPV
jgi:hypothetical protein